MIGWVEGIQNAIDYIEENLTEELKIQDIAGKAYVSAFHFQRIFNILCGFTVGEYIRSRRRLATQELSKSDARVVDVAIKYGYDSPDSFTRAFTKFHGISPSAAKLKGANLKSFAQIRIKIKLEGGTMLGYKIVEKAQFTVMGKARRFNADTSCDEIPEGYETRVIPAGTWAVFPCRGALPKSLQDVNKRIWSEWLPSCKEYKLAGNYNIEMYTPPTGNPDAYYCEIWVPVEKI